MRTLLAAAGAVAILAAPTPAVAVPPQPGAFTGYAFDACEAPAQATMDAWRVSSPFAGVGVYIAGENRLCDEQPNLTAGWVQTQTARGWRILPITVGRQASCFDSATATKIDPTPGPNGVYDNARIQGRAQASASVNAGAALGLPKGTTHWIDIENFNPTHSDDCRRSMLRFVSGWTQRLHELGHRSGLYSNVTAGIATVENARIASPGSYVLPDQIWFAHYDGRVTTDTSYVADSAWKRQRVHQYLGDQTATYGGVALAIDRNWMDINGGTRVPAKASTCGVSLDFATYPALRRGATGKHVKAMQCLIRQRGVYDGRITGRYDAATAKGVLRFQRQQVAIADTGTTTAPTWTALLSAGTQPFAKVGTGLDAVRRLQRALNAASSERLAVTGIFDRRTEAAVKRYQARRALPQTGVVTTPIWVALQQGRR